MNQNLKKAFQDFLNNFAEINRNVVLFDAGQAYKNGTHFFSTKFSERYVNFGLAPANMFSAAAAFALRGKTPVICLSSLDLAGNFYEQILNDICFSNLNVKIIGFDAGLSAVSENLAVSSIFDLSLLRTIPNLKIYSPIDYYQALNVLEEIFYSYGPTYLRLSAKKFPLLFPNREEAAIDGAVLGKGGDIALITSGDMVYECSAALKFLKEKGIYGRVIDICRLKPINSDLIMKNIADVKMLYVVEDHILSGGLFSSILEIINEVGAREVFRIGLKDVFIENGSYAQILKKYALDAESIAKEVYSLWRAMGYY